MTRQDTCDVIVAGGVSSAFECALSARQNGAERVAMVEKAPPNKFGGNARFSHTAFRIADNGPEYTDNYEKARTISGLAKEIGLSPEVLANTVDEYNAACRTDVPFDPSDLDGKCSIGLNPDKSNWAEPIAEPPFRAYRITCSVTFSFGGIQIDTKSRVLDFGDNPIEGRYASGDVVGLFFHNYPSCTGQTRNAVFSRLAGQSAASLSN